MQRGVFGIAARLITYAAVAEIHRIAFLEARYRIADFFDDAGAIATEYCGQFVGIINRLGAQLGIQRIHACGGEFDAQMVR